LPTVRPGAGIKGRPAEERENRRGRSNSLAQVLNSGAPVETDKAVGGIDDCAGAAREHGWYGRRWRSWRTNSFPSRVSYTISPCALCRQKPKVGAECPNWARWDLCGGPVMSVPAANTSGSALGGYRTLAEVGCRRQVRQIADLRRDEHIIRDATAQSRCAPARCAGQEARGR